MTRPPMPRILVIDDDDAFRAALAALLTSMGHVVAVAAEGAEGLQKLESWPADLVITDIVMPGKEGLETITAIKQHYPSVRIIAMSGSDFGGVYLRAAKQLGAPTLLQKPFSREKLTEKVAAALAAT